MHRSGLDVVVVSRRQCLKNKKAPGPHFGIGDFIVSTNDTPLYLCRGLLCVSLERCQHLICGVRHIRPATQASSANLQHTHLMALANQRRTLKSPKNELQSCRFCPEFSAVWRPRRRRIRQNRSFEPVPGDCPIFRRPPRTRRGMGCRTPGTLRPRPGPMPSAHTLPGR